MRARGFLPLQLLLRQGADEVPAHLRGSQQCPQPDAVPTPGGIHRQRDAFQLHCYCWEPGLHSLHHGRFVID